MQLSAGTMVAGRFRLVRPLGRGGMGAVWLGQDTTLDTPCAIKFIHDSADTEDLRARFQREAKVAAQLRSPHVVHVLDHGLSDGTPYMAMEYLEGEDLGERLKRMGRLGREETVSILSQVGKALTKAQAASLVHRDLKPANIFLSREDDHDFVRVLDFGVAKTQALDTGQGATKTGMMLGTPYYMSPEQARGTKALDYRSDLWALAVIAFQCLTGHLPFMSDSLGDLLIKIVTEPLPMPSHIAPDLPPSFDAWWARAAMRDPAQRFQSARELIDALALSLGIVQSGVGLGGSGAYRSPGPPGLGASDAWRAPSGIAPSGVALAASAAGTAPGMPVSPAITTPGAPGAAPVALSSSSHAGVLESPVVEKPAPPPRRVGRLIAAVAGVVLVGGGLAAALAFRGPTPGASTNGAAASTQPQSVPPPSTPPPATTPAAPASAAATADAPATASAHPDATASAAPVAKLGKPWPSAATPPHGHTPPGTSKKALPVDPVGF